MTKEEKEKEDKAKEIARINESKPPYKTITEGQLYVTHTFMNPQRDRYMEFTNMQGSMVFSMVMGMVRERAADPTRDRLKEPLSEVMRVAYCQCQRGVGFKMSMLAGNVALGMKSDDSNVDPFKSPRNTSSY